MAQYKSIAQQKAAAVNQLIPPEWRLKSIPSRDEQRDVTGSYIEQFLSPEEIKITSTDAEGIVAKTSTGKWRALDVAKAFFHRAAIAHQLVNCLHEIFFDSGLEQAQHLDDYFSKHGKSVGPLHGLPVSLKDQFHVKGVETHMGYVGWINTFEGKTGTGHEKVFESEMVKELRSLGAVLYCKTSVPSTLMCGETVNNIIDYTWNPANRNLSSGGSSGGEGALIGLRGSPAGFGTDIGGSIRIPAAFNGLYGLKPSSGRLPYQGMANSMDGQNSILSVVGPLATTPGALQLLTEAILSTKPWLHDPLVVELPWRNEAANAISNTSKRAHSGLSFGFLQHDGVVTPHPPIARALQKVRQVVEQLGHQVIEWKPTQSHAELSDICGKCWSFDGGADARQAYALSGEEPATQILSNIAPEMSASEIMKTNIAKRQAQKAYMEYWNSTASLTDTGRPVDAIISPVAPFAAARPAKYTYYTYSAFVNVLDYTAVVIPVLRADKSIDTKAENFRPCGDMDRDTEETYNPEIYDGSWVSIQLVGRRLEEEKMLALAQYVSEALNVNA